MAYQQSPSGPGACNNRLQSFDRQNIEVGPTFVCKTYDFVYRIDTRHPDEIFETGFEAKEPFTANASIVSHLEATTQSFISTTCKYPGFTEPEEEADMEKVGEFGRLVHGLCASDLVSYVYKIRPNSNFFNVLDSYEASKGTELYEKNEMAIEQCIRFNKHEEEIISIAKIPPELIESAMSWELEGDDFWPSRYFSNENFNGDLTSHSNEKPFEKII